MLAKALSIFIVDIILILLLRNSQTPAYPMLLFVSVAAAAFVLITLGRQRDSDSS